MYYVHRLIIRKLSNKMETYILHYNLVILFLVFVSCFININLCIVCLSKLDDQAESNKNRGLDLSGK